MLNLSITRIGANFSIDYLTDECEKEKKYFQEDELLSDKCFSKSTWYGVETTSARSVGAVLTLALECQHLGRQQLTRGTSETGKIEREVKRLCKNIIH